MSDALKEAQFRGLASSLAESAFSASFNEDRGSRLANTLLREYQQSDTSQAPSKWLKERLASIFLWKTEPPRWIESAPMWPFLDGEPMVFIDQIENSADSDPGSVQWEHLTTGTMLYVFGKRVQTDGGWKMSYRVMEQFRDLP